MKLTPLEVRKQTFRKTMRGFDPEEVRIFLDMVADEYERSQQENGMLREKVRYLNERLEEYHNLEKTLQNSILTAERISAESREHSRTEAESIINEAHVRSERILEDSRSRLRLLGEQVHHLSRQKETFVQRFQDLLDSQMQYLSGHREELKGIDELDAQTDNLIAETTPVEDHPTPEIPLEEELPVEAVRNEGPGADPEPVRATPAVDEPRAEETVPVAQANATAGPTESEEGFFQPNEREEGFFEISAEEGARK